MCERLENTIQHDVDQFFSVLCVDCQKSNNRIWCNIMECLSSVLCGEITVVLLV